jgi:hypothetical protein
MRRGSRRLDEFPLSVMLWLECRRCGRAGRCRLEYLAPSGRLADQGSRGPQPTKAFERERPKDTVPPVKAGSR